MVCAFTSHVIVNQCFDSRKFMQLFYNQLVGLIVKWTVDKEVIRWVFPLPRIQYMYASFFGDHSPDYCMVSPLHGSFSGKGVIAWQLRPTMQKRILYGSDILCYVYCRYGQAPAPGPWQQQLGYQAPPPITPKAGATSGTSVFFCFTKNRALLPWMWF